VRKEAMGFSLSLFIILLDQLSKWKVHSSMALGETISLLPFFSISYVTNTGAAFGVMSGKNVFFICVGLVLISVLFVIRKTFLSMGLWGIIGWAMLLGGGAGNLVDRFMHGHVTDFLDFYWKNYHWYTFNLADSFICVGACIIFFIGSFSKKPDSENNTN
jgi:signal peptidase II